MDLTACQPTARGKGGAMLRPGTRPNLPVAKAARGQHVVRPLQVDPLGVHDVHATVFQLFFGARHPVSGDGCSLGRAAEHVGAGD